MYYKFLLTLIFLFMDLTLKVTLSADTELLAAIEGVKDALLKISKVTNTNSQLELSFPEERQAVKKEPEAKPKAVKTKAVEPKAAEPKAAEPEKAEEVVDTVAKSEPAAEKEVPSFLEVRALTAEKIRAGKRAEAIEVLKAHGAGSVTELMEKGDEAIVACYKQILAL